jgi:hypothetical protein
VRISSARRVLLALLPVLASCGEPEQQEPPEEPPLDTTGFRRIIIVDSIGVETGEEPYVFGSIESATHAPDSSIVVLDRAFSEVRVFTPGGDFVRSIGGQGSGPGELNMTVFMCLTSGGRLFVSQRGGMNEFDYASGQWIGGESVNGPPPAALTGSTDSSFVGVDMQIVPGPDGISIEVSLSRFRDPYATDVDYLSGSIPMTSPTDVTGFMLNGWDGYAFDVDPSGCVYVSPYSTDRFLILGFTPEGNEMLRIERSVEPVPKSESEIAEERDFMEARCESMGMGEVDFHPESDRRIISAIGIDGEGRIWARRGTCPEPVFDVFDSAGDSLFTAFLDGVGGEGRYWRISIDPEGMTGWSGNPVEGYQKLYILALEE